MALDKTGKIQRPMMGPSFLEETLQVDEKPSKLRALRVVLRLLWRVLRTTWRLLTYDPLKRKLRIEEGGVISGAIWGFAYRLAFAPILLAGFVIVLVWAATHPLGQPDEVDPSATGLYFDAVTFSAADGVQLEGALFPVIDAKQILAEQEKALRKRYPAVLLVHDFGMRKDQMLPLVRPLHDAGFVVLAMNLRGSGASGAGEAQTFGLREARDVKAAVEMLRRRPSVDATRVTIVGAGTGGTAAMLYAKQDMSVAALVVADPIKEVETLLDGRLAPRHKWLTWLKPLCKWTFEMGFQLDIDEVAWQEFESVRQTRPVLVLGHEGGRTNFASRPHIEQIQRFLVRQVVEPKLPVVKMGE